MGKDSTPIDSDLSVETRHRYLRLLNAMTPEERGSIDLLLDLATRVRIARAAEFELAELDKLIAEHQRLATIFARLDIEEDIAP
jgi:signal recognition particle GTPase